MKKKCNFLKSIGEFCKSHWWKLVHVLSVTTIALLFARFIIYDLFSLSVFAPVEKTNDFQMSDIYQSISMKRALQRASKDITIVSIDGCGRQGVLDAINRISKYSPAAIGLDVVFEYSQQNDSLLFATLSSTPNLVCAGMYEVNNDGQSFRHINQSFYEDSIAVTIGYVNLDTSSPRGVVRRFVPYVLTADSDTLLTFPTQLAKMYKPLRYKELLKRGGEKEIIAYDNIQFRVVPIEKVLSGEVDATLLSGRIVLMGDIGDVKDKYCSPSYRMLSGIELHAYALQTIISNNYIKVSPNWLNWLIALLLCMLFAVCNLVASYRMGDFGNLFMRLLQLVMMYILVVIGCTYFAFYHNYIDFSPAILMIGFGSVSFDLWFGCIAVYKKLKKTIQKLIQKKLTK
jgi:CHASE2 domain-containing sensor protein